MGSLITVLIAVHLAEGEKALPRLAETTSIPLERLVALQAGAAPRTSEVAILSDSLDVDPVHLFRSSPSVSARREITKEPGQLSILLDEIDAFLATYAQDLRPNVVEAFSTKSFRHARTAGEGWASRVGLRTQNVGRDLMSGVDPLLQAVEHELSIPVIIWPVSGGSAGATIDFSGTVGIWVNSHDQSLGRQRFTLAHEVAHVLLRHVDTGMGAALLDSLANIEQPGTRTEKFADACASGILYDRESLSHVWAGRAESRAVALVAGSHGLSYSAALVALRRNDFIDQFEYESLSDVSVRSAFSEAEAEDLYRLYEGGRDRVRLPEVVGKEHLGRRLAHRIS